MIFKEPSQIKYLYNYTSAIQKVFEYECEETGIYVSASFNVGNVQYEIYKKNAILIKISDKNKWLIKFVEHKTLMKKDVEFYEKIIDITDTNLKVEHYIN